MKSVAIYNLKGGVGKTTTVVNLAFAAARRGARTLVWDLDPQAASSFYLRLKPKMKAGGKALFKKKKGARREVRFSQFTNIYVIPADFSMRHADKQVQKHHGFRDVLKPLAATFDVTLLDCAPVAGAVIEDLVESVDGILVPLIPTTLSVRTYEQMCRRIAGKHPCLMPFFNMVDRRKRMHRDISASSRLSDTRFLETLIPSASEIEKMGLERAPLGAYSKDQQLLESYDNLWDEISDRLMDLGHR